jgi:hypothetical protein
MKRLKDELKLLNLIKHIFNNLDIQTFDIT